jgi:hypothetical protein
MPPADRGSNKLSMPDERLTIVKELKVGALIPEIDGEGSVFTGCFNGLGHVSSPCRRWWVRMKHGEVNVMKTPPQQASGYQKEDDPEPARSKLRGIAPKEIEMASVS